jgi:hypothetical protein
MTITKSAVPAKVKEKSLCAAARAAAPGEEGFAAVTTSYIFSTMSCLSAWRENRRAEALLSNQLTGTLQWEFKFAPSQKPRFGVSAKS